MGTKTDHEERQVTAPDAFSLLAIVNAALRRRRLVQLLGLLGLVVGLLVGLLPPRQYRSTAVFQPQTGDQRVNSLALMASRFGLEAPAGEGDWSAPVYVELLRMRALLEPLARDTVIVAELGERVVAVSELLQVDAQEPRHRIDRTVKELRRVVRAKEISHIGAVQLSATTRWPSVSLSLVERLVRGVDRFNVETRRSQAAQERAFVAMQAEAARLALRDAEAELLAFLQANRIIAGSPELTFEHERRQREVNQRQQVYTSLIQSLEEARIREVRDIPVITMLEMPRAAVEPLPRLLALKAVLGLMTGLFLGLVAAFCAQAWREASHQESGEARELIGLVKDATPRLLRRRAR